MLKRGVPLRPAILPQRCLPFREAGITGCPDSERKQPPTLHLCAKVGAESTRQGWGGKQFHIQSFTLLAPSPKSSPVSLSALLSHSLHPSTHAILHYHNSAGQWLVSPHLPEVFPRVGEENATQRQRNAREDEDTEKAVSSAHYGLRGPKTRTNTRMTLEGELLVFFS